VTGAAAGSPHAAPAEAGAAAALAAGGELDAPAGGDEFTAILPWKGAIVAPSAFAGPQDPSKVDVYIAGASLLLACMHVQQT
jgi:hypothetical protein